MMLALKFAAGEDEDGKILFRLKQTRLVLYENENGNMRFDPWHGMTTIIVLIARLVLEEIKTSTGEITKLGDKHFGPQNRLDLAGTFARNKLAPSMAIAFNYASTNDE
jgi:hypothetical protein